MFPTHPFPVAAALTRLLPSRRVRVVPFCIRLSGYALYFFLEMRKRKWEIQNAFDPACPNLHGFRKKSPAAKRNLTLL